MKLNQILKLLSDNGISCSMHYNQEYGKYFIDLNTKAKNHLYLYEDGILRGRYDYETEVDLNQSTESLLIRLCREFDEALHGRDFYNADWATLCKKLNIPLFLYKL